VSDGPLSVEQREAGVNVELARDRRPSLGLCEALDSKALLGAELTLSRRQREPCEAIDDGARLIALEWGRRSFKSGVLGGCVGLWHCLPRPEFDGLLRRGQARRVIALATNVKQAREVIQAAEIVIASSPVLRPMVEARNDLEIRFAHAWGPVIFSAMPANAAGDRGRGASCVLMDEFAHHFDGDENAPRSAESLLASVVPSVSEWAGLGTLVVASTPSGDSNRFAAVCDSIVEDPSPTAAYFFGKTWDINPRIREDDLREERRLLGPELFAQEYECSRLSGAGQFLNAASIEACVSEGGVLPYEAGLEFSVGIDPALSSDVFGVVVIGVDRLNPSQMVCARVLGWQGEKSDTFEQGQLRTDQLLAKVVEVCHEYHATRVATDVYKAREIGARLGEHGIQTVEVPFTGDGRRQAFARLRMVIDEGRIDLPREPQLLTELRALRVKYSSQGQVVEIPRLAGKSHCDRAVALCLGIAALEGPDAGSAPFGESTPPTRGSLAGYARERGEGSSYDEGSYAVEDAERGAGSGDDPYGYG
jgi:hypothetical protein